MTQTPVGSPVSVPQSATTPPRLTRRLLMPCCGVGCALIALPLLIMVGLASPHIYFIPSAAMEPTLNGGESETADLILTSYWEYRFHLPSSGDLIVFLAPKKADAESLYKGVPQKENILVKRIIGVPQDTILIEETTMRWKGRDVSCYAVFRNGVQLDEPYIKEPMETPQPSAIYGVNQSIKLGADEYFVMGDNRNDSNDSRYWGPLEKRRIVGKVMQIVSPSERTKRFP